MSERLRKVNELIREEASRAMAENLEKDDFITVTGAETTPDLKFTTIWVSIMGDEKEVLARLEEKKSVIQHQITSKMATKYTPRIQFKVDHSQEYAAKIEKLLKEDEQN